MMIILNIIYSKTAVGISWQNARVSNYGLASHSSGIEMPSISSRPRIWDQVRLDESLGPIVDLTKFSSWNGSFSPGV